MKQRLQRFWKNETGVAMIEFMIVFPIMLILVFTAIEMVRYILIMQKMEKSAYVITDSVARLFSPTMGGTIGEANATAVQTVLGSYSDMMWPYAGNNNFRVVVSSVFNQPRQITRLVPAGRFIRWQQTSGGLSVTSLATGAGPVNTTRTVLNRCTPAVFDGGTNALLAAMLPEENMIVGEVFFHYQPIYRQLLGNLGNSAPRSSGGGGFLLNDEILVRRIYIHPRNGNLLDLPDTGRPMVTLNSPCVL